MPGVVLRACGGSVRPAHDHHARPVRLCDLYLAAAWLCMDEHRDHAADFWGVGHSRHHQGLSNAGHAILRTHDRAHRHPAQRARDQLLDQSGRGHRGSQHRWHRVCAGRGPVRSKQRRRGGLRHCGDIVAGGHHPGGPDSEAPLALGTLCPDLVYPVAGPALRLASQNGTGGHFVGPICGIVRRCDGAIARLYARCAARRAGRFWLPAGRPGHWRGRHRGLAGVSAGLA